MTFVSLLPDWDKAHGIKIVRRQQCLERRPLRSVCCVVGPTLSCCVVGFFIWCKKLVMHRTCIFGHRSILALSWHCEVELTLLALLGLLAAHGKEEFLFQVDRFDTRSGATKDCRSAFLSKAILNRTKGLNMHGMKAMKNIKMVTLQLQLTSILLSSKIPAFCSWHVWRETLMFCS